MVPAPGGAPHTHRCAHPGALLVWPWVSVQGRSVAAGSDQTPEPLSSFLGPTLGSQASKWVFLPPALWVSCLEENIWWLSMKMYV